MLVDVGHIPTHCVVNAYIIVVPIANICLSLPNSMQTNKSLIKNIRH
jgi:hypothetical protein